MRRDGTRPYRSASGRLFRLSPPAGTMATCPRAYDPPETGEVLNDVIRNLNYKVVWVQPCHGPRGGLRFTFVELQPILEEIQK